MASPCILLPVTPVHHDIVYRYVSLSEALQRLDHLGRCLIPLAALPVSHGPFRHYRSLSCKGTVSADDLVHIIAGDEVPVHLFCHLAPPLMLCLLDRIYNIVCTQTAVGHISIRFPLDFERSLLSCLKAYREFVCVWIPCSTPALWNDSISADLYGCIACIV